MADTVFWTNNNGETEVSIINADAVLGLKSIPDKSIHCCITSPPYFALRSYLPDSHDSKKLEIGREDTPEEYVARMVDVFRQVKRVLRDDGTLWVVIGDSYAGSGKGPNGGKVEHEGRMGFTGGKPYISDSIKPKDLIGIPWLFAFAMRADGWYLRKDIIWEKQDPVPESVRDRPTSSHEYIFLFAKSRRYFYDLEAIREPVKPNANGLMAAPSKHESNKNSSTGYVQRVVQYQEVKGANRRSVWNIATGNYSGAHFATFPTELVELCIKAGTSEHGACPVCGSPWRRMVKVEGLSSADYMRGKDKSAFMSEQGQKQNLRAPGISFSRKRKHIGWQPTCDCLVEGQIPEPVPCTVLDPFLGSGTTILVAQRMGRNGIGTELYEKYCHIAKKRIGAEHRQLRIVVKSENLKQGQSLFEDKPPIQNNQIAFPWEDAEDANEGGEQ